AGVGEPAQTAAVQTVDLVQVGDLVDDAEIERGNQSSADGRSRSRRASTAGRIARREVCGHLAVILQSITLAANNIGRAGALAEIAGGLAEHGDELAELAQGQPVVMGRA